MHLFICIHPLILSVPSTKNHNHPSTHTYLIIYLLTYSIEQSPSWEGFAANQEIPLHFMEPESSLLFSQVPATCPCPEPSPSSLQTPSHFLKIHLNIILPPTSRSHQWSVSLILCTPLPSSNVPRVANILSILTHTLTCPASLRYMNFINVQIQ